MGGSVDDGFVGDVEIVGDDIATVRPLIRWRLHEAGDEDDAGIDLVGDGAGKPFRVAEIVGGQSGSPVARGFDGTRGEGIRSIRPRRPEAGHGGAVYAVFVPEGHPSVPQQVEPRDGRRSSEERFEPVTVQGVHGCGEDGLLIEDVLAAPLLEEPDKLRGMRPRLVEPIRV